MNYLEMTEIVTSNIKYLRGKLSRFTERIQEKTEHKINIISGVWHVVELHWVTGLSPRSYQSFRVASAHTQACIHVHTWMTESCAPLQSPRFASSIFFQSVSLLLATALCIHFKNL